MAKKKAPTEDELKEESAALQAAEELSPSGSSSTQPERIDAADVLKSIFEGYGKSGSEELQKVAKRDISRLIEQEVRDNPLSQNYNIAIIYDSSRIVKSDADAVYSAVANFDIKKPVLLILYSYGGDGGSAYLIGQLFREYSNGTFVVTVPRAAKSAATLLCCAADFIHMGGLSELGPVDPQFDGMPALGLKNSIEHIAQLVSHNPASSEMFAKYLNMSLRPIDIGYYERVAESSLQYAERLLQTHGAALIRDAKNIAYDLVYTYKDHGFVIDKIEAGKIFGNSVIKINTPEYALGNSVYNVLKMIEGFAGFLGYDFYFNGTIGGLPVFRKRK